MEQHVVCHSVMSGENCCGNEAAVFALLDSFPGPRTAQQSISAKKAMLIVFIDWCGLQHCEFIPRGQTVDQEFDMTIDSICEKQCGVFPEVVDTYITSVSSQPP
jgi:hypothetical protein